MPDIIENLWQRLTHDEGLAIAIELLLIALSVNWCVSILKGTRGTRLFKGVLILLVIATLGVRMLSEMGWSRLDLLYRYFVIGLGLMALVAFQPELRRAFIRVGDVRFMRRGTPQARLTAELVDTAGYLSRNRFGGLIAIQRRVGLRGWAENGTILNADVTATLLNTIFFPRCPLHDLGVIIQGTRILAANCQFPQAESDEIAPGLGSRHRAAVGMSFESDALILVVSEETGTISLADNGDLKRGLTLDELAYELRVRLSGIGKRPEDITHSIPRTLSAAWRPLRRILVVLPIALVVWYLADQASQINSPPIAVELRPITDSLDLQAEITRPSPPVFSATFRGSTRKIGALRERAADGPIELEWRLGDAYEAENNYSTDARSVIRASPTVQSLGLAVQSAAPGTIEFTVDGLVTERMPVVVDSGNVNVGDVRIEPAEVEVKIRRSYLQRIPAAQRVVRLPVGARLESAIPDQLIPLENVAFAMQIGGLNAAAIRPPQANVSLKVVGRVAKRTLRGVRVNWLIPETIQSRYEVVARDPNELLVDLTVEGERNLVDSLDPEKIHAFVRVTSEFVVPNPNSLSATVEVLLPPGVTLAGRAPDVQLRLVERPVAPP